MYKSYNEIPANLRRVVLLETEETRIKNVSLRVCNEIIAEYIESEKENEALKDFTVSFINRNGKTKVFKFKTLHEAQVKMDAIIGHDVRKRTDIGVVLKQAGRIITVYYKGQYMRPAAKDRLVVKTAA
jgi:hypothetical protein